MGSDRSRVSYDAKQQYRAVVVQQGRVTVEADWNEMQTILNEEVRKEILDIIGPTGTSTADNGYRITQPEGTAPFDFVVNPGTMYVGGIGASLDQPVNYGAQSDWLDRDADPDWVDPTELVTNPPRVRELVYLYMREQEVSAVEDSALLEPALGGPDTAARVRLIQHIVRFSTDVDECTAGLAALSQRWATRGLTLDDRTLRLMSQATLKVDFNNLVVAPDPCEPTAQGGYVGAENQLIRVQISASDRFVWGFDNASFLYRVEVIDSKTLRLLSRPIDAHHEPRALQAVEVLRSAAQLSNGEHIASARGVVYTLTADYDRDTQTLTLPADLPPEYQDPSATPQVFLRVWQEEKAVTPGTVVSLGDTGLQVTLQTPAGVPFHSGDYWLIAVRPGTPQQVYPPRYLKDFQPPDGPRLWVCPLALLAWSSDGILNDNRIFQDCRGSFVPLTSYIPPTEGIQVLNVLAKDASDQDIPLRNGMELPAESLAKGLRLLLKQNIDPATVNEAVCFVTLELPFSADRPQGAGRVNAVIGYQPIALAAEVQGSNPRELFWSPIDDTKLFLQLGLSGIRRRGASFQKNWDIVDPPGTRISSQWAYGKNDVVVQTASIGTGDFFGFGLGTISVNKQRLRNDPQYLGVTATTTAGTSGHEGGLIFNWNSEKDYWVYNWQVRFPARGFGGAFDTDIKLLLMHIVDAQIAESQRRDVARLDSGPAPEQMSLDIRQAQNQLLFGAEVRFRGNNPGPLRIPSFALPQAPQRLLRDTGVGMMARYTGSYQFTRLEVVYPDESTVLIPAGANRALTRLTLKRNFLQPLTDGSSQGTAPPPAGAVQPQADFEQWFWLIPAVPRYAYYGSGGANMGIGGSLI